MLNLAPSLCLLISILGRRVGGNPISFATELIYDVHITELQSSGVFIQQCPKDLTLNCVLYCLQFSTSLHQDHPTAFTILFLTHGSACSLFSQEIAKRSENKNLSGCQCAVLLTTAAFFFLQSGFICTGNSTLFSQFIYFLKV